MAAPGREEIRGTHGYHPVTTDLGMLLATGLFDQLLVFGSGVPDVIGHVNETRLVPTPAVQLPQGVYWFTMIEPPLVLLVSAGRPAGPSARLPAGSVTAGSPLDHALGWA